MKDVKRLMVRQGKLINKLALLAEALQEHDQEMATKMIIADAAIRNPKVKGPKRRKLSRRSR